MFVWMVIFHLVSSIALPVVDSALDIVVMVHLSQQGEWFYLWMAVCIAMFTLVCGSIFASILEVLRREARGKACASPSRTVARLTARNLLLLVPIWWPQVEIGRGIAQIVYEGKVRVEHLAMERVSDLGFVLGGLRLLEAAAEATPQLVLQAVLAGDMFYNRTTTTVSKAVAISIFASILSISFNLMLSFVSTQPAQLQVCGYVYFMCMLSARLACFVGVAVEFGFVGLAFPVAAFAVRLFIAESTLADNDLALVERLTSSQQGVVKNAYLSGVVPQADAILSSIVASLLPIFPYLSFPTPFSVKSDYHPLGSKAWKIFILNILENNSVLAALLLSAKSHDRAERYSGLFAFVVLPTAPAALFLRLFTNPIKRSRRRKNHQLPFSVANPIVNYAVNLQEQGKHRAARKEYARAGFCGDETIRELVGRVASIIPSTEGDDEESSSHGALVEEDEAVLAVELLVAVTRYRENHALLRKAGGIELLVRLLDNDSDDVKSAAVAALAAMAVEHDNGVAMTTARAVPRLVGLILDATSNDESVTYGALVALSHLSSANIDVRETVSQSVFPMLALLLGHRNDGLCLWAARCIANLATNSSKNQDTIARDATIVPKLTSRLQHSNDSVRIECARAIATIAHQNDQLQHLFSRELAHMPDLVEQLFGRSASAGNDVNHWVAEALGDIFNSSNGVELRQICIQEQKDPCIQPSQEDRGDVTLIR